MARERGARARGRRRRASSTRPRCPARALVAAAAFRETIETLRAEAPRRGACASLVERVLELSGYGARPRPRGLAGEPGPAREPRRAARRGRRLRGARGRAPSLAGFLDRAALLSETDRLRDDVPGAADDAARRQGPRVRVGVPGRARGGPPAPLAEPDRRGRARGGAAAVLRRHDPRAWSGSTCRWARSRQVFGQRRLSEPSRFLEEIPEERLERTRRARPAAAAAPGRAAWARPSGVAAAAAAPRARPALGRRGELRPGVRVRHPLFGVGHRAAPRGRRRRPQGDGLVPGVGAKKLVARFAGLELV